MADGSQKSAANAIGTVSARGLSIRFSLIAASFCMGQCLNALAAADGPDHYAVRGVAAGSAIDLRSEPRPTAPSIGRLPADAACVRNLGCQGGLTLDEFSKLDKDAQQRRLQENPRWCKVEYQGTTGWVEGQFLAEAACAAATAPANAVAPPPDPDRRVQRAALGTQPAAAHIKAQLKGRQYVDYVLTVAAGQTLTVAMKASNRQNYFNVNPPGSEAAMFIGSTSGMRFQRVAPMDGDYVVRVYLMRAAARRNESSRYSLDMAVTGKALLPTPAAKDALVPGTTFHASAQIPCTLASGGPARRCDAYAMRRGFGGNATLEVLVDYGVRRHVLFVNGKAVSSDAPDAMKASRHGDVTEIEFDQGDKLSVPDAFIAGG